MYYFYELMSHMEFVLRCNQGTVYSLLEPPPYYGTGNQKYEVVLYTENDTTVSYSQTGSSGTNKNNPVWHQTRHHTEQF